MPHVRKRQFTTTHGKEQPFVKSYRLWSVVRRNVPTRTITLSISCDNLIYALCPTTVPHFHIHDLMFVSKFLPFDIAEKFVT